MARQNSENVPLTARGQLYLTALSGVPMVEPGDDLADTLLRALAASGCTLQDGDILVIAQKIVSKSEGRLLRLDQIEPSPEAERLARETAKDARLVELVLRESNEVVRSRRDVLIVEHKLGFVMANAGIDQSNVSHSDGAQALLLPEDPDKSCEQLRQALKARLGVNVAVIINDSHGRAFRNGTVGVAIGVSGLPALVDLRGRPDLYGRRLQATDVGLADEIASAASLLMGQAAEGCPVVLVRGLDRLPDGGGAADLVRPKEKDLFRTVPPSALVDLMHRRWSVRRYTKDAVSDDIVLNVLRAAVQAPSAHNRQPWRFTVIKSPIPKEKLATAMANRLREDRMRDGDNVADIERDAARSIARIAGAPLVVLVSMTLEDMDCYADAARSNAERAMAVQGTAMAVQNLLLSAEAFGLGASVMCAPLFCQDVVRRVLALPPQWEPQMLVTMGRPANQGRPSSRRRLNDVVHFIGDDE